eukprot:EG_transcript_6239
MVRIMVSSTLLYLSPHVDVAVFAHPSWELYGPQINATLFVLLDETEFFGTQSAPNGTQRPPVHFQAASNKLRILQLMPSAWKYDVIVMLDADIVVRANFLPLMGTICRDTLYTVSHHETPRSANHLSHFQSRSLTPEELSYVQTHNAHIFNTGQFLFRPSPFIEKLLQESYKSYMRDPLASLYEQGHLNVVALLSGRVQYSMTHLVLLGFHHAILDPSPAEWPLIHVCGADVPAYVKGAVMLWRSKAASRSLQEVRQGIVQRLLRRSNQPISSAILEGSRLLIDAYSGLVSRPNVTQICEVGGHGYGWYTATAALVANPSAGLAVFASPKVPEPVVHGFPMRVTETPGSLEDSLKAYTDLVAAGQRQPCNTILLPQGPAGLESTFNLTWPIMAHPLSFALVQGDPSLTLTAPLQSGTASALNCFNATKAGASPSQWCVWKLQSGS